MTSKEYTDQGITALKEGDKSRAHDLLRQAVELDSKNAKAWFFLYRTQTSVEEQRISLQKVLEIMPNNKPAREALETLPPVDEDFNDFEYDEPIAPAGDIPTSSGALGVGVKPVIRGITLPIAIPDAPLSVEPQTIMQDFIETFKNGVEILRSTPEIYGSEIQRATWWRFWQFAVIGILISGIVSTLASTIIQVLEAMSQSNNLFIAEPAPYPSLFMILATPVVIIPLNLIALYIGVYASHRFVTSNRAGRGSFVAHSYAIILPVVTAILIGDVATLVFSFAPLLSLLLFIALTILWIYSMYVAAQGLAIVHSIDIVSGYWTVAVLAIVEIVTVGIGLAIFSALILPATSGMI
jgi:hypothetical protein